MLVGNNEDWYFSAARPWWSGSRTGRLRDELLTAIHGRGAFRRFKDTISRHGVEEQWRAFKEEVLKEMAREWCEENGVE